MAEHPGGAIRGRVVTASGSAVAGTPVMIGGDSPPHPDIAAVTSPTGDYELGGLVPGEYEILANVGERVLSQRVSVTAGEVAELDFVAEDT